MNSHTYDRRDTVEDNEIQVMLINFIQDNPRLEGNIRNILRKFVYHGDGCTPIYGRQSALVRNVNTNLLETDVGRVLHATHLNSWIRNETANGVEDILRIYFDRLNRLIVSAPISPLNPHSDGYDQLTEHMKKLGLEQGTSSTGSQSSHSEDQHVNNIHAVGEYEMVKLKTNSRRFEDRKNEIGSLDKQISKSANMLDPETDNQISYIYVMNHNNRYKIGYAIDPEKRYRTFRTANLDIELLVAFGLTNSQGEKVQNIGNVENSLHHTFRDQWISGEWFSLANPVLQVYNALALMHPNVIISQQKRYTKQINDVQPAEDNDEVQPAGREN
ncbi:hypothetical protein MIR68_007890 [Amoeboaphelidium protococcarum]|nr:hypothetical protein MIR68_007890 [Amoeboaphelidium protococcarum]